mgnify:CR=1 FL=1
MKEVIAMLPETMKRKEYMNMLKNYPDVLKIKDMCEVLGGISTKTGYKLLRENKIESIKVGREYCITKISVVDFLMRKNKITFLVMELLLLILALFFVWKIFNQNVPEKRVAVVLPEAGDNRWDALIKGMKQSAKNNHIHLIICNTDEIENAEMEKEIIKEQKHNNIDAFIICPAPGSDTKDMLKKQCAKTPYTLIMEDVYSKEGGNSGNPVIGPDYYKMGSELGKQLGEKRQKIGVVTNWKESKSDQDAIRGLKDSLKDSKSEIDWYCYRKKDQNIYEKVSKKDKVDAIVVLDPHALEELGEQSDEDSYQGADIYGIGSSVKAVVLLDNGNIQGLVVPDAYEIGYKSVGEMAQKLEHRFYRLKGHKTEIKVFDRDEFSLNDNLERFLYSYE